MKDIYGLLLVLGFLIIISQCTSKSVESFLNSDSNSNCGGSTGVGVKPVNGVKPINGVKPVNGGVSGYNADSTLLASIDNYGFNVPPSMQQNYTTNLSFGKAQIKSPKSFISFSDEALQGAPIDSSMGAFDPSAKGGLSSLIGQTPPTPSMPMQKKDGLFGDKSSQPSKSSGKMVKVYMVYGDWCGWSKKALGPFREAMNTSGVTTSMGTPVEFALVEDTSDDFKNFKDMVKGFPTFVVGKFENGNEVSKEILNVKERTKDGFLNAARSIQF